MMFARKKRRIVRVLVVEDEPLVAFDTEHFLRDEGFEIVATIDSVADALDVLAREPLDLVVADINLADGTGISVAEEANRRGIQVLFVTGACPGEAQALAAGCLSKPYQKRDLLLAIMAIESVLDGEEPRKLPPSFSLFKRAA